MKRALFFLILIFLINLVGMYYGLYQTDWWFDTTLHFLGGFFMAMFMSAYLFDLTIPTKIKKALVIIGAVSFIGVVWEFAEYIAKQTLTEPIYNNFHVRVYFMGDLEDTIKDLFMDIVGSLFWFLILIKPKSSPRI